MVGSGAAGRMTSGSSLSDETDMRTDAGSSCCLLIHALRSAWIRAADPNKASPEANMGPTMNAWCMMFPPSGLRSIRARVTLSENRGLRHEHLNSMGVVFQKH